MTSNKLNAIISFQRFMDFEEKEIPVNSFAYSNLN